MIKIIQNSTDSTVSLFHNINQIRDFFHMQISEQNLCYLQKYYSRWIRIINKIGGSTYLGNVGRLGWAQIRTQNGKSRGRDTDLYTPPLLNH